MNEWGSKDRPERNRDSQWELMEDWKSEPEWKSAGEPKVELVTEWKSVEDPTVDSVVELQSDRGSKVELKRGVTTGTCAAAAAQGAALLALSGKAPASATIVTPKGVTVTLRLRPEPSSGHPLCQSPEPSSGHPSCQSPEPNSGHPLCQSPESSGGHPLCQSPEPNSGHPPFSSQDDESSGFTHRSFIPHPATCLVEKYSGDDPDVTNGILVFATVTPFPVDKDESKEEIFQAHPNGWISTQRGITILLDGGVGVGRVTKPGLACAVGQAAINPTPRHMIVKEVRRVAEDLEFQGSLFVEIAIPKGQEVAKKTYNPRLGILGGISILGTGGIVEPMSEQALIDTIKVEMNMRCAEGAEYLLLTPGNYGETFLRESMGMGQVYTVKCSNFLGDALAYAEEKGMKGVLLVSHIGKLVKVAAGMMNTHSKYGDGRMEVLSAHAALQGAKTPVIEELMAAVTTDDGLAILDRAGIREQTLTSILAKVQSHLEEKVHHSMKIGAVMFSNQYGYLGQTPPAAELIELL